MLFYTNLLRYLYTLAYYLAIPGLLVRMWWRSFRHNRAYSANWRQRFGFVPVMPPSSKVIWIHAVSMGETIAAAPLVKELLNRYTDYQIVMTATTPTGSAQAAKYFNGLVTVLYFPYDLPDAVNRFLNRIHPDFAIILETELWPNVLSACVKRNLPLLLANARLSARSCRAYQRIAPLAKQMVNSFVIIAAQSESDGQRFLELGLDPKRLSVTGNIKFDIQLPADLSTRGRLLREQWGVTRPVWVAASTHEGEESIILDALRIVRAQLPEVLLVLAPRHPERFVRVGQMCTQARFNVAVRSQQHPVTAQTQILLADTMGELMLFYAAADIAFVGGSFVAVGGHNLIEPAILSVAVLTGPHLHNFIDISQLLLAAAGVRVVNDAESLAAAVIELMKNPEKRREMGENGQKAVIANTGALQKHLQLIDQKIKKSF